MYPPPAQKPVGGEGTEGQDALPERLDDGRTNRLLLLAAHESAVSGVGIQGHDGDARLDHSEVLDERAAQRRQVADDLLFGDAAGDLRDGDVFRHEAHAQPVAAHDHHGFALQFGPEVFGVARVAEFVALDRLLVERSRDDDVQLARLEVAHGGAQRFDGGAARFGRRTPVPVRACSTCAGRDERDLPAPRLGGRGRGCELHGFGLPERISVIGGGFRRSVDDGGKELRHARIGERLEDDLPADAVRVALRDAYFEFLF